MDLDWTSVMVFGIVYGFIVYGFVVNDWSCAVEFKNYAWPYKPNPDLSDNIDDMSQWIPYNK